MPSAISNLKAKINDLKTRVDHNSISPVFVGGILDEIVDASTAAAEAAAAQSTADSALSLATANSDRLDLHADDINNLQNDGRNNATEILANTEALTVLNRRGQVESFAGVLTTDPDDDPIPAELVGKRVWSTQRNEFIEVVATEASDAGAAYLTPEDRAAVVDKFYRCGDRLFLGIKVSAKATTLLPLFADAATSGRTHDITLTLEDDQTGSWSGVDASDIRLGDVLIWNDTDEFFKATVVSETTVGNSRALCGMFARDGDYGCQINLLWLFEDGFVQLAVFDSSTADGNKGNLPRTWNVGMNLGASQWSWQEADGTTGDLVDFREQVKPGDIIEISPADRFSVISCGEDYALCIIHNVCVRDGDAQRLFLRFDGTFSLELLATGSGTTPSPDAGTITPEEIDALIDSGGDDELPADFEPFTTDELDAIING